MGEPSRDRHSGVCRPLERGDMSPGWVGEAGALLGVGRQDHSGEYIRQETKTALIKTGDVSTPVPYVLPLPDFSRCPSVLARDFRPWHSARYA